MSQALMVELIQTAHRPAAEISEMKKEVVDGVERATVAVLEFQRAKEAAISSGDLAGYNLDPRGLVRFNEWDDNSDSKKSSLFSKIIPGVFTVAVVIPLVESNQPAWVEVISCQVTRTNGRFFSSLKLQHSDCGSFNPINNLFFHFTNFCCGSVGSLYKFYHQSL
jgi:hypothetical protein